MLHQKSSPGGPGPASASPKAGVQEGGGARSCGCRPGGGRGLLLSGTICDHRLANQKLVHTHSAICSSRQPSEGSEW